MLSLVIAAFVVAILASFAQAVTGFGFALVAVPLLALVIDLHTAVVGATLLSTVLTAAASVRYRRETLWRVAGTLTATALVGMPLGLLALVWLDQFWLSMGVAVLVILFATANLLELPLNRGRPTIVLAGLLGGVFLTSTGMNGPPLVAATQALGLSPRQFRATLQTTFAAQDILAVAGFALVGQLAPNSVLVMLAGLLGIPIGWVLGDFIFGRLRRSSFRIIVSLTLVGCAVLLLVQALLR